MVMILMWPEADPEEMLTSLAEKNTAVEIAILYLKTQLRPSASRMAGRWAVPIKTCKEVIKVAAKVVTSVKKVAVVDMAATEVTKVAVATETVATTLETEVVTEVTVGVVVLVAAAAEDSVDNRALKFLVFLKARHPKCYPIISASLTSFLRRTKKSKLKYSFTWSILAFSTPAKMPVLSLSEV